MQNNTVFNKLDLTNKYFLFIVISAISYLLLILFQTGHVFANCGVQSGSLHDYAGVVIDVRVQDSDGNYSEANSVNVEVKSVGETTTPPGGVINLSTGTHVESREFKQSAKGCPNQWGMDNTNIVVGTNGSSTATSGGSNWALDCDNSIRSSRSDLNPFQRFEIRPTDIPDGAISGGTWKGEVKGNLGWTGVPFASTLLGSESDDTGTTNQNGNFTGGSQWPVVVAPRNGGTRYVRLTYVEPPAPELTLRLYIPNCNTISGRVNYRSDSPDEILQYKLFFDGDVSFHSKTDTDSAHNFSVSPAGLAAKWGDGSVAHTVMLRAYHADGSPALGLGQISVTKKIPCNDEPATCSIEIVDNQVPGAPPGSDAVKANNSFNVIITIKNNHINDLPANSGISGDKPLSATVDSPGNIWGAPEFGSLYHIGFGQGIPSKGEASITYTIPTSPDNYQANTISMYVDYWGLGSVDTPAQWCSSPVNTYKEYEFTASAQHLLTPDDGSPTNIKFDTSIKQVANRVPADGTATRSFRKNLTAVNPTLGACPNPDARVFDSTDRNCTDNLATGPPYTLGDFWCATITLDRGHGWRSGGTYLNISSVSATDCPDAGPPGCVPGTCAGDITYRPYVRVYGADVAAGGGFGSSCSNTPSKISAFTRPVGQLATGSGGSGTQLAAMALGNINGFASASLRYADPQLPRGLTFANTSPASVTDGELSPLMGGSMSGTGWCSSDYYGQTQYPVGPKMVDLGTQGSLNVGTLDANKQSKAIASGTPLQLAGQNNYTSRKTLYIDGDVVIKNNIAYTATYASVDAIPNFTLVVKGNIYIENTVSQLDGLYIAQPLDNNTKGYIYTCSDGSGSPITTAGGLYTNCGADIGNPNKRQLTVNGGLVAQRIVLNRTGLTIEDATSRELANNSKAAEIIKFSPEMYLSPPLFSPRSTAMSGEAQYITTLPPIL